LKTAVCIKQVPVFSDGKMDPEKGVILRDGLVSAMNVYDLPAVETALRLREEAGGTADVFSMGPLQAADAIREAYAMGIDQGYLLSDHAFSGADVLATSYTLAQGIKGAGKYDLIICGRQTTDGDTGQVGAAIAQWLHIPYAGGVTAIISRKPDSITLQQRLDDEQVTVKMSYPCLIAVDRSIYISRMKSLPGKIAARKKGVAIITLQDLEDHDPQHYGLSGSATKVEKIYPPERTHKEPIMCLNTADAVNEIMKILENSKAV